MDISLIIPCYNEELNIKPFFSLCLKTFPQNLKIEYIFINDGSKDNTLKEIKDLIKENKNYNIIGLDFSRNFGKEAAMLAGLEKSTGQYVALIDADLQQHPKYVYEMYNYINENPDYDCIACYPAKRKDSKPFKILKKLFYKTINKLSDIDFYENASDFRLLKREVVNSLLELKEYHRFSKGFFSYVGYNCYYMPYQVEERKYGKTSWNFFSLIKYALDGIIGFSTFPLKIATFIGVIAFIISVLYAIIIIVQKLTLGINVDGYATIVCLILLFGGLQMIFMGILGEYLGRTYVETKKRPIYIIKKEYQTKERSE